MYKPTPTTQNNTAAQYNKRGKVELDLSEQTTSISKFCSDNGFSICDFLIGVFQLLFYRYTGQDVLVVGVVLAGKQDTVINNIDNSKNNNNSGTSLHPIALRAQFEGNVTTAIEHLQMV